MTDLRFGSSTGLLQRLRPTRITAADLREVAEELLPCLATPELRAFVLDRPAADSLVVLEEGERSTHVSLAVLAGDMTAAGVRPTPEAISDALSSWVAHRPVPDGAAAASGIAVLTWSDARRRAVGWRVVVRRGDLAVAWAPTASTDPATVACTRAAALERSRDVVLDLRVEGPVALWSHSVPVLATAGLAAPERLREHVAAAGLSAEDLHVVVTPERPVACAGPAVAARLAGETPEDCVILPWALLPTLPWL
jgi:hypothetical protein